MQYYKIQPTVKKSVIEWSVYTKDVEGGHLRAQKELGWRTGVYFILVPETDDDLVEWHRAVNEGEVETAQDVLDFYGVEDMSEIQFLPSEDDDFIELCEYYHEMDYTWDGCWEVWDVTAFGATEYSEEDLVSICESVEEKYNEEYEDGLIGDGWVEQDYYTEIHCPVTIEKVDCPWGE